MEAQRLQTSLRGLQGFGSLWGLQDLQGLQDPASSVEGSSICVAHKRPMVQRPGSKGRKDYGSVQGSKRPWLKGLPGHSVQSAGVAPSSRAPTISTACCKVPYESFDRPNEF